MAAAAAASTRSAMLPSAAWPYSLADHGSQPFFAFCTASRGMQRADCRLASRSLPVSTLLRSARSTPRCPRSGSCRAAVLRVALAYALLPLATTGSPLAAAASASPRLQSLLPPRAPGRPAECVMPFSASLLGRALSASAGTARRATAAARRVNRGTSTAPWVTPALRDGTCRAAAGMSSSAGSAPVAAAAAEAAPILDGGAAAPSSNGGSAASAQGLRSLEDLPFDNTFTAELPGDISESNLPRQVRCQPALARSSLPPLLPSLRDASPPWCAPPALPSATSLPRCAAPSSAGPPPPSRAPSPSPPPPRCATHPSLIIPLMALHACLCRCTARSTAG